MSRIIKAAMLGSASIAQCLMASAAVAQDATEPAAVEEIIVTATKRQETLQDVPLSITAITGDQLKSQGVESFSDLARLVPGVVQSGGSNFSKFAIRGIQTTNSTSSAGEQKQVAVYLDELPLTSFSILTPEIRPYDVERVEVLRGPQGTLFGSGTLAGAVRFITNKPNPKAMEASLDADFGVTDGDSYRKRLSGMINLPLVDDQLALRLVGFWRDEDGYIDNVTRNEKNADGAVNWGGRASLRWAPTDRLTATLMATYDNNKIDEAVGRYNPALGLHVAASRTPFNAGIELTSFNGTIEYDLGFAAFTSSTTYADSATVWNLDINSVNPALVANFYHEEVDTKTFVQDARLVSTDGSRFGWVLGAFYLSQNSDFRGASWTSEAFANARGFTGFVRNLSPALDYSNDIRVRKNYEGAIYGELTYKLTDTLSAAVGARVTEFEYSDRNTGLGFSSNFVTRALAGGTGAITITRASPITISTGRHKRLTTKVNLTWKPTEELTFYGLASEGFRRQHPNGLQALNNGGLSLVDPSDVRIPLAVNSDSLWNFELGAKAVLFNGKMTANLALYYIPWKDMQVSLVRASDGVPFVGNVGKAVSKGIELELRARPTQALDLGMNLTVQSAKVTELTAAEARLSGAILDSPMASPDFQISGFAQYNWALSDRDELFVRGDIQHLSGYPNSFPFAPGTGIPSPNYFNNPSYENVNFSVGLNRGNLKLQAYVENVLDEDKPININASGSSTNRYLTLRPRTFGLRIGWRY